MVYFSTVCTLCSVFNVGLGPCELCSFNFALCSDEFITGMEQRERWVFSREQNSPVPRPGELYQDLVDYTRMKTALFFR